MFKTITLILLLTIGTVGMTTYGVDEVPQKEKQIYVFSMNNCRYCHLLKEEVLADPRVRYEISKIKIYYVHREKVSNSILRQWKIKSYPTVVAVERVNEKQVIILERYQMSGVSADAPEYSKNKKKFLKFLGKYIEKDLTP